MLARRLPIAPAPVAGEWLGSWVGRAAFTLGLSQAQFLRTVGVSDAGSLPSHGIAVTDSTAAHLAEATGLTPATVTAMTFEPYAAAIDIPDRPLKPAQLRQWQAGQWVSVFASRFCPLCVADLPVLKTKWRFGLVGVCRVHHVLLVDVCPACGRRPRSVQSRQIGRVAASPTPLDPAQCGNLITGPGRIDGRCRQTLGAVETVIVRQTVADRQHAVLGGMDSRHRALWGRREEPWVVARTGRFLVALVRAVAIPGEVEALLPDDAVADAVPVILRSVRPSELLSGPLSAVEAAALTSLLAALFADAEALSSGGFVQRWLARARRSGVLQGLSREGAVDGVSAPVARLVDHVWEGSRG
ncbi:MULTISPECIES: TniQ family protein [Kitasatospora]|uniref:TniQ domain-containing protein n=1 Tax=Kitasatospora setae (strain ATCC 33774 / DSM 43861 / JCM 3304 / KCC A-0304 / NBRC 14216 / KM-6054) TaxID=452652 RepID=E4NAG9_KITSK|nr:MULTISPECIES: TniQ family protein [Kitasatospora]BAJ28200.1 hypothetical protein KSE_23830 [Kitasatospora setae KM-6054]